jgi:hypothetical protein
LKLRFNDDLGYFACSWNFAHTQSALRFDSKTAALNHSAISPFLFFIQQVSCFNPAVLRTLPEPKQTYPANT